MERELAKAAEAEDRVQKIKADAAAKLEAIRKQSDNDIAAARSDAS